MREPSVSDRAYTLLADGIRRGVYPAGQRLPGERTLADQLKVSRSTLRKVLGRLQADGSLIASAQQGWFLPPRTSSHAPTLLQSFTEMAKQRGLHATSTTLEATVRSATLDEAAELHIAPAEDVFFIERLRGMGGPPVCLDRSTMPAALVQPLTVADLTDQSLYERLETLCGLVVVRSSYAVTAEAADERLANLLDIPPGSPVLVSSEVSYTKADPVILGSAFHRGDAYRFEADLFRPQT